MSIQKELLTFIENTHMRKCMHTKEGECTFYRDVLGYFSVTWYSENVPFFPTSKSYLYQTIVSS